MNVPILVRSEEITPVFVITIVFNGRAIAAIRMFLFICIVYLLDIYDFFSYIGI